MAAAEAKASKRHARCSDDQPDVPSGEREGGAGVRQYNEVALSEEAGPSF